MFGIPPQTTSTHRMPSHSSCLIMAFDPHAAFVFTIIALDAITSLVFVWANRRPDSRKLVLGSATFLWLSIISIAGLVLVSAFTYHFLSSREGKRTVWPFLSSTLVIAYNMVAEVGFCYALSWVNLANGQVATRPPTIRSAEGLVVIRIYCASHRGHRASHHEYRGHCRCAPGPSSSRGLRLLRTSFLPHCVLLLAVNGFPAQPRQIPVA